jgi:hypothetical protein
MWSAFHRAVLQNSEFHGHREVVAVTAAYLEDWRGHPRADHWPKQPRQKRRPAALPLWKSLNAVPIIS